MVSIVYIPGDMQGPLLGALSALSQSRGDIGAQSQNPKNRQMLALPLGGGELPVSGGVQTQVAPRPCGSR